MGANNYLAQPIIKSLGIADGPFAFQVGITEVPCRSLHHHIQQLMQTEPGENITAMEMEFKRLSVGLQTESVSSAVARFVLRSPYCLIS